MFFFPEAVAFPWITLIAARHDQNKCCNCSHSFRHWANELKPDAGLSRRRRNLTAVEPNVVNGLYHRARPRHRKEPNKAVKAATETAA